VSAVTIADLAEVRRALAELLDRPEPILVDRKTAGAMLDLSDTTFGRLVKEGHIRPTPNTRPAKYSTVLLRRWAEGDSQAFAHLGEAPSGSTGTAAGSAQVSPLPHRPHEQRAGGRKSTARGGPTTPAA